MSTPLRTKKSTLLRTQTLNKTVLGATRGRCVSRHIAFRYKRTHTHHARVLCGSFSRERRERVAERAVQQNGVRVASFFRRRRRKKKNIIFIAFAARGTIARETRTRSYDRIGSKILGEDQNDEEEIRRDRSGWRDVRRRRVVVCFFFVFFSREITSSARR